MSSNITTIAASNQYSIMLRCSSVSGKTTACMALRGRLGTILVWEDGRIGGEMLPLAWHDDAEGLQKAQAAACASLRQETWASNGL